MPVTCRFGLTIKVPTPSGPMQRSTTQWLVSCMHSPRRLSANRVAGAAFDHDHQRAPRSHRHPRRRRRHRRGSRSRNRGSTRHRRSDARRCACAGQRAPPRPRPAPATSRPSPCRRRRHRHAWGRSARAGERPVDEIVQHVDDYQGLHLPVGCENSVRAGKARFAGWTLVFGAHRKALRRSRGV